MVCQLAQAHQHLSRSWCQQSIHQRPLMKMQRGTLCQGMAHHGNVAFASVQTAAKQLISNGLA